MTKEKPRRCKVCGRSFTRRESGEYVKQACSSECSLELVAARKRRAMKRHANPSYRTRIEKTLFRLVFGAYRDAVSEYPLGPYRVDVFVPSIGIAFEADGAYWHRDSERDARRDAWILDNYGVTVVRFTEKELKAMRV